MALATAADALDTDAPAYVAGRSALEVIVSTVAAPHVWSPLGGGKPSAAQSTALILALMLGHAQLTAMGLGTDSSDGARIALDKLAPQSGGKPKA